MPRRHLTQKAVDAARHPETGSAPYYLWDDELRGFGLRLYRSGASAWVLRAKVLAGDGERWANPVVIGTPGALSLKDARRVAAEELNRRRSPAPPPSPSAWTIRDLHDEFFRLSRFGSAKTELAYRDSWRLHILPRFSRTLVRDLAPADLLAMRAEMSAAPVAFNRAMSALSSAMQMAERDFSPPWRAAGTNPCSSDRVARFQESPREGWYDADELAAIWRALGELELEGGPAADRRRRTIAGLRLLFLTGARPKEIFGCQWPWVHLYSEHPHIALPRGKGDRAARSGRPGRRGRVIALSPEAVEILRALPPVEGSPYLFPARGDLAKPLRGYLAVWRRVVELAGVEYAPPYALRHSYRTLGVGVLAPEHMGDQLGQKTADVTDRWYRHLQLGRLSQGAERMEEALLGGRPAEGAPN